MGHVTIPGIISTFILVHFVFWFQGLAELSIGHLTGT